jgi:SAM-dependent methyltransferase
VKPPDHFSAVAERYARQRPSYPEELFAYLARVAPGHGLVWDCAAGSGQASLPLARHFRRVVATDASAAMLAQAPPHPSVEYRMAPAHLSGLIEASADLVTVAQALHWFDLAAFYGEVDRVLRPGGVLAVWTYGSQVLDDSILNEIIQRFYREIVGPYWPPERRHVEAGYRTLPFPYPELEPLTFDMKREWDLDELLGYIGTWSACQRFREAKGVDPVPGVRGQLLAAWGGPQSPRRVRWPLSLRVGVRPA